MLAITADSALPWVDVTVSHHPHAFATSHDTGSAVLSDHPHLGASPVPAPREMLTAVLPPRPGTALAALGLAAALIAGVLLGVGTFTPTMRGPPMGIASLATGQHIVTRFCIARR
ncbi:MAG: hypothetical protein WAM92_17785 [Mycobacterium sp.]